MNDATTPQPTSQAPSIEPERDDEVPSPEFASALADFEKGSGHAAAAAGATVDVAPGAKRSCTVVRVGDDHVFVDFGGRCEGAVETRHYRNEDGSVRVGLGDVLELFVLEVGDQVLLAPNLKLEARDALKQIRGAHSAGVPVSGKVTAVNSGGLTIELGGARGFCPLSQIELGFCSDPSSYVGRTLDFLVTSIEEGKGGAVVSRRAILKLEEAATAQQVIVTLKIGDEREGTVARLEPFGAFVDLGGVHGMVHVSEIRHERTGHPNQVLTEGQKVTVRVMRIENGKDGKPRIALSMRAAAPDPWTGVADRFTIGGRVTGKVVRLTDFGAFVNLAPGIDGLVHVSEISYARIAHPKHALHVGDDVEALVQSVDTEKKRVSLSIKKTLDAPEWSLESERPRGGPGARGDSQAPRGGGSGRSGAGSGPRGAGSGPRGAGVGAGPRGAGSGSRGAGPGSRGAGPGSRGAGSEPRPSREGRESRDPREPRIMQVTPQPPGPPEPTTMALALRKAIEAAKQREHESDAEH